MPLGETGASQRRDMIEDAGTAYSSSTYGGKSWKTRDCERPSLDPVGKKSETEALLWLPIIELDAVILREIQFGDPLL